MDRIHDILNSVTETVTNAAQQTYKGQKRSELKDSDFLFPETRSFPIVTPADVPDAISNFGRMKGQMSYDTFLRKLYNMCKRKGPAFVAALPDASKEQLGINKSKSDSYNDINQFELGPSTMKNLDDLYGDDEENDPLNNTNAMLNHVTGIYNCMGNMMEKLKDQSVHKRLTDAGWHDKISAMYHSSCQMQDFVMNAPLADDDKTMVASDEFEQDQKESDLPIDTKSGSKPGLWDNIRKKKERMGKKYKPAKPGDKDRPDPEQWKKLTK